MAPAFAVVGAWPVLPYSVLELAVLGRAFAIIERRANDWERLTRRGRPRDRRAASSADAANGASSTATGCASKFASRGFAHEPRLTLRFAGEAMGFGEALSPGRRVAVAQALRRLTAAR